MTVRLKSLRIVIPPQSSIQILPSDNDRKYLLIGCSVLSSTDIYLVFYPLEQSLSAPPLDGLNLSQGGYYEPNVIPNNEISLINVNTVSAAAFVLYA